MTATKPMAGELRAARATRMEWDNAKRAQIIAETSGKGHNTTCRWLRLRAALAKVTEP